MKTGLALIIGIFLVIFSIDGILLLDSSIPECAGFTGMGWFVLVISMSFESMTALSNHECLPSFYVQTGCGILFVIGLTLIVSFAAKRRQNQSNEVMIGR